MCRPCDTHPHPTGGLHPDGWVYKTFKDWGKELHTTERQLRKARWRLQQMGLIETRLKRANGAPTVHYRANLSALASALRTRAVESKSNTAKSNCGFPADPPAEDQQMDSPTFDKSIRRGCANPFSDGDQMELSTGDKSLTEITTETTSEITTDIDCSSYRAHEDFLKIRDPETVTHDATLRRQPDNDSLMPGGPTTASPVQSPPDPTHHVPARRARDAPAPPVNPGTDNACDHAYRLMHRPMTNAARVATIRRNTRTSLRQRV